MKSRIALLAFLAAWLPLAGQGSVPAEAGTITFSVGGGAVEFDFWEQLMRDFQAGTGIDAELMRKPMDTGLHHRSWTTPEKRQSGQGIRQEDSTYS